MLRAHGVFIWPLSRKLEQHSQVPSVALQEELVRRNEALLS